MTFSKESKYNQFNIKSQEESCRNKYKKPDLPFWKIRLPVVPAVITQNPPQKLIEQTLQKFHVCIICKLLVNYL